MNLTNEHEFGLGEIGIFFYLRIFVIKLMYGKR